MCHIENIDIMLSHTVTLYMRSAYTRCSDYIKKSWGVCWSSKNSKDSCDFEIQDVKVFTFKGFFLDYL